MIPLSTPSIQGNEWIYIKECLDTEWVSSAGKFVDLFEDNISNYCGSKYAIAVVNGTSAIHTSLLLCGIKPEDEVIVPTITFIAPVNAIRYCHASPIFMDSDQYYNIDVEKTMKFILEETKFQNGFSVNIKTNKNVIAIIPVNVFGNACLLDELVVLCKERNIKIIEDATESLGTRYSSGKFKGRSAGIIGDIGCLSFNGNKIITTGGGGMILTNNDQIAEKAKYLTTQAKVDPVRYIHDDIGYNYRMTNIQSALGVAQLEVIEDYIKAKIDNFNYYKKGIDKIDGLTLATPPDYARNNHWMYALQIDKNKFGFDVEYLMNYFSINSIQTRPLWYPNHLQKPYLEYQNYKIEKALELHKTTLNIPCSVNLSQSDIDFIIRILMKI